MTENQEKKCGQCGIEIIHTKIIDTYQNRNTEKLQWQTKSTHKAHFKFAGEGKWQCITPESIVQESMEQPKTEEKPEISTTIKVDSPFAEAELITRWASERAYKITMAEVSDFSKLTQQEKSALGQKTGMLTRCLADLTIALMKLHNVKSNYGPDSI